MEIALRPELREFVEAKVRAGEFASANDVIAEALELLRDHDSMPLASVEYLRRELAIGVDQSRRGEGTPMDMNSIKERVRQAAGLTQG